MSTCSAQCSFIHGKSSSASRRRIKERRPAEHKGIFFPTQPPREPQSRPETDGWVWDTTFPRNNKSFCWGFNISRPGLSCNRRRCRSRHGFGQFHAQPEPRELLQIEGITGFNLSRNRRFAWIYRYELLPSYG